MWLRIYLAAYFVLVAAGVLSMWQAGVLERLPFSYVALALLLAVGLGVLLAIVSRRPA